MISIACRESRMGTHKQATKHVPYGVTWLAMLDNFGLFDSMVNTNHDICRNNLDTNLRLTRGHPGNYFVRWLFDQDCS